MSPGGVWPQSPMNIPSGKCLGFGYGQSWRRPGASRRWSRRRWSQERLCCLPGIAPDLDAALRNGGGPGARTWEDVSRWTEMNFFIAAKQAGWLDAVRYFSSMSLRSMQAWSHWEKRRQGVARHRADAVSQLPAVAE